MDKFQRQRIPPSRVPQPVLYKWSELVLDEGFVPFPKRLVRCLGEIFRGDEGIQDLQVVLAIVDYRRPNLTRQPSLDYLAFLADMTPAAFRQRLDSLRARGLLTVDGEEDELNIEISGLLGEIEKLTAQKRGG